LVPHWFKNSRSIVIEVLAAEAHSCLHRHDHQQMQQGIFNLIIINTLRRSFPVVQRGLTSKSL
tara:strand:+ start:1461 stop:1649 length:189 start_codon:yes stop_codon:yes gene_type:complete